MAARYLAVNADDFGFTGDVNSGIVEAHTHGILTSATLMANGDAFEDALHLAGGHPTLDIGVHCVLVGGTSLLHRGRDLPASVSKLLQALALGRIRPYDELRPQFQRIFDSGLRPTHADAHKHTHLCPPVLAAVTRLCQEFGVRWVRRPYDLPLAGWPAPVPAKKRLISRTFPILTGSSFRRLLTRHHCQTTRWFAGFQITGRYTADDVLHLLRNLPEGSTEFMVHPGHCGAALQSAPTRLKASREAELSALTDARVVQAVRDLGISLTPFSQMQEGDA